MKHLPLFYYSSTWIWVDDDKILLSSMEMTFSRFNSIKAFNHPNDCVDFLNTYQAPSASFRFLQPSFFDITAIVDLLSNPNRHSEISAMVIDYNMPEMSGVELAKETAHLTIPRILLTGNREDSKSISGLANGLIERYVQKAEPEAINRLIVNLKELTYRYFQNLTTPLLSYLQTNGKIALSDPTFIDFFETYCDKNAIKEYYLIDINCSFLCINDNAQRKYFIVHTEKSLNNWFEINAEYLDGFGDNLEQVRQLKKIPFFGLHTEVQQTDPAQWQACFYTCNLLEGRVSYYWAEVQ